MVRNKASITPSYLPWLPYIGSGLPLPSIRSANIKSPERRGGKHKKTKWDTFMATPDNFPPVSGCDAGREFREGEGRIRHGVGARRGSPP